MHTFFLEQHTKTGKQVESVHRWTSLTFLFRLSFNLLMVLDYSMIHLDKELSCIALVILVELRLDIKPLLFSVLVVVGVLKFVEKLNFLLGVCHLR